MVALAPRPTTLYLMKLPASLAPPGFPISLSLRRADVVFAQTSYSSALVVPMLECSSPDELIEAALQCEDFDVYSAQIWPSSVAATAVLLRALAARNGRVCELGCGPGLPSLAALAAGSRSVVATDWSDFALAIVKHASSLQPDLQSSLSTARVNVFDPESPLPRADYYVAADMLYDEKLASALGRRLAPALQAGAILIVADPFRLSGRGRTAFVEGLRFRGRELGWELADDVADGAEFEDECLPRRWACATTGADIFIGVSVLSAEQERTRALGRSLLKFAKRRSAADGDSSASGGLGGTAST